MVFPTALVFGGARESGSRSVVSWTREPTGYLRSTPAVLASGIYQIHKRDPTYSPAEHRRYVSGFCVAAAGGHYLQPARGRGCRYRHCRGSPFFRLPVSERHSRSEEHTSELQSPM